jgi:pimeloyl-ACP methyl ester carboxylesterase
MKMPDTDETDSHLIRCFPHGNRSEEALVLIGGPGPSLWEPLVSELKDRRFLLITDFLHSKASEIPECLEDVPTLAANLEKAVNREKVRRIGVVAWSMGVKVAVELCKRCGDRVIGSVLLCGTAGRLSEETPAASRLSARFDFASPVPAAAEWLLAHADRILRLRTAVAPLKSPSRLAKRFGFIDTLTDDAAFDALVGEFLSLDFDASPELFRLQFPHLTISGEKDILVPPMRVRAMAVKIPRCEYFEVKSGTHYLPVEYGELLALKIDDFFCKAK